MLYVRRTFALMLAAGAVAWAMVIVAAPIALQAATAVGPAAVVYEVSSRICHQRPERSFAIAGFQMPVCARCSALYLSAAVGVCAAWSTRRRKAEVPRAPLVLAALPTAATFALEAAGVMSFSNVWRAMSALPLGAFAGWLFVSMLRYDSRLDGHQDASR